MLLAGLALVALVVTATAALHTGTFLTRLACMLEAWLAWFGTKRSTKRSEGLRSGALCVCCAVGSQLRSPPLIPGEVSLTWNVVGVGLGSIALGRRLLNGFGSDTSLSAGTGILPLCVRARKGAT